MHSLDVIILGEAMVMFVAMASGDLTEAAEWILARNISSPTVVGPAGNTLPEVVFGGDHRHAHVKMALTT